LHEKETDYIDQLNRIFKEKFGCSEGIVHYIQPGKPGIQLVFSSVIAAQLLAELCPGTACTKRIPEVYRHANEDIVLALVRGMVCGDGCEYDRKVTWSSVSLQMAEDFRQLLISLGIMAGISSCETPPSEINGRAVCSTILYTVQTSGTYSDLFKYKMGWADVPPDKLWSHIGVFDGGYLWYRVNQIDKVDATEVIGFGMKGDHTFCTWGVATHNSDNAYIPILPLPIGQETVGGDGRALLLSQEIRVWSEHIVAGMGVPNELIFGGLSYSGSNVSLRMLENMFLGYLSDQLSLLRWVIDRTASYLGWPKVGARFKPFKMADDLQRKAYLFQLNQAGKMSDESLMADAAYDSAKEDKIMEMEASRRVAAMKKQRLLQAEMEGEAMLVTAKWQNKAQAKAMVEQAAIQTEAAKEQMAFQSEMQNGMMQNQVAAQTGQPAPPQSPDLMPKPRDPALISPPKEISSPLTMSSVQQHPATATNSDIAGGMNVDLLYVARQLADRISRLTPAEKPVTLRRLQERSPELHDTVVGLMMSGANGPTAASAASARGLPKQKPPQRGPEAAMV